MSRTMIEHRVSQGLASFADRWRRRTRNVEQGARESKVRHCDRRLCQNCKIATRTRTKGRTSKRLAARCALALRPGQDDPSRVGRVQQSIRGGKLGRRYCYRHGNSHARSDDDADGAERNGRLSCRNGWLFRRWNGHTTLRKGKIMSESVVVEVGSASKLTKSS